MYLSTITSGPSPSPSAIPFAPISPNRHSGAVEHFTGARATSRIDAYQRLLTRSLSTDFGLPVEHITNDTRIDTHDGSNTANQPRNGPLGILAGRLLESMQFFFEAHRSEVARARAMKTDNATDERDGENAAMIRPILPFTMSGMLKKFRRCDRSFSEMFSTLTDDSRTRTEARKKLFMAAERLDDAFSTSPSDARRSQVCEVFVSIAEDIDATDQRRVMEAIRLLSHADSDKNVVNTTLGLTASRSVQLTGPVGTVVPSINGSTVTTALPGTTPAPKAEDNPARPDRPERPLVQSVAAVSGLAYGIGSAAALPGVVAPMLIKHLSTPPAIDVAAAGIVVAADSPPILPPATAIEPPNSPLMFDPSGVAIVVVDELDTSPNSIDKQDPTFEYRNDPHAKHRDEPALNDYLHWKSQETDIDFISLDNSDNGDPLFYEWNDSNAKPPSYDADSALLARVVNSEAISCPPPPLFRWFDDDPPPATSFLPKDTIAIDGRALIPTKDKHGLFRWRPVPLALYEGPAAPTVETGQWVEINGVKHIRIDNRLYPVKETLPGQLWIYSLRHADMPWVPLAPDGETWCVKTGPNIAPDEQQEPGVSPVHYVDGDKFILSGNARLPVDRRPILGEDELSALVHPAYPTGRLSGPDEEGFLTGVDYKLWIEGERGYYAVDHFDLRRREVRIEGLHKGSTKVLRYHHAMQHWHLVDNAVPEYAMSERHASTSIEDNWRTISGTPFLRGREPLQRAIFRLFDVLQRLRFVVPNRPGAPSITPTHRDLLYAARSAVSRQLYSIKHWETLSPLERQYADAKAQALLLKNFEDDFDANPVGMCGEHAALAFHLMPSELKKDGSITRITFREYPGSGRNHEALLISDSIDIILAFFGDILANGVDAPQRLFTRSRVEFEAYLFENRDHLLLIDTWASQRLIDFKDARSAREALLQIYKNLREAGFGRGLDTGFSVRASVPKRGAITFL